MTVDGVSRAAAAGHPAVRDLRRRDDAHRRRRRRSGLRAARGGAHLSRAHAAPALRRAAVEREGDDVGRHADRRRAGLQLRRDGREHPARRCSTSSPAFTSRRSAFLLLVNAILLVLGCLLEGTTILLVIVPIFIPTAKHSGIDRRALRRGRGRQRHDRPAHAAVRPAAVHRRQHDPAAAASPSCASAVPFIAAARSSCWPSSRSCPRPSCGCRASWATRDDAGVPRSRG